MARTLKLLIILFFMSGVLLGAGAVLLLDRQPGVEQRAELSVQDLQRIQGLVRRNYSFSASTGRQAVGRMTESELNLVADYALQQQVLSGHAQLASRVHLHPGEARLRLSYSLPAHLRQYLGGQGERFINLSATLRPQPEGQANSSLMRVENLKIGFIRIPDGMTGWLMQKLHQQLIESEGQYASLVSAIERLQIKQDALYVHYQWDASSPGGMQQHMSSMLVSEELRQGLIDYAHFFSHYSQQVNHWMSFSELLKDAAAHAQQKMHLPASIENKALFISLAACIMNRDIERTLGLERTVPPAKRLRIKLRGRHDLAKHFIISAGLASLANPMLAESIGLEKEIKDATGGSGFSYADLAADHAGIYLAQQATRSDNEAEKIQKRLQMNQSDSALMLEIRDLPEGIMHKVNDGQDANSKGRIDSLYYREMKARIISQIEDLPLYR